MGNDLYWKQTPKPVEEELHGISMATWGRLSTIFNKEMDQMEGLELDRSDLGDLEMIKKTALALGGESEFAEEVNDLITGIKKFDSITLIIRG